MSCQNSTSRTSSDGRVGRVDSRLYGSIYIALRPKMTNGWMRNWIAIRRNRSILLPHKLRITQTNSSPLSEATTFGSSKTHRRGTRRFSFALATSSPTTMSTNTSNKGLSDSDISSAKDELDRTLEDIEIPERTAEAEPNCRSRGAEHALQAGDEEPGKVGDW